MHRRSFLIGAVALMVSAQALPKPKDEGVEASSTLRLDAAPGDWRIVYGPRRGVVIKQTWADGFNKWRPNEQVFSPA